MSVIVRMNMIKLSPVMNSIILVLLFCVIFLFVSMSSEQSSLSNQAETTRDQPTESMYDNLPETEREIIFDTAQIEKSDAHQALFNRNEQSLDIVRKKADAIIADTEHLIKEHGLDQVDISDVEKQALVERQAELQMRLEDIRLVE